MKARILAILALVLLPATTAFAEDAEPEAPATTPSADDGGTGFRLSTNLGVTKFFDDGPTGFGLDVYPGFAVWRGLVVEAQLGVHTGRRDVGYYGPFIVSSTRVSSTVIPFEVGARYAHPIGPVTPFGGFHMGPASVRGCAGGTCDGEVKFGLNVGGGAEYQLTDAIGVGIAMWFHNIFVGDTSAFDDNASIQMFHFGAHATFAL